MDRAATPDPQLEEKALVARMLDGDERAMEQFADDYFPPLYRFALSRLRGDRELTRELVQTTVVKALSKLASFRGDASLTTWLAACCRNEIGMHLRRRQRRPQPVELDEASLAPEPPLELGDRLPSPESALASKQTGERVHAALDRLPPHYARALEWKYVDRLSVADIGRRLGSGPKAAESLLSRARRAFRTTFEGLDRATQPVRRITSRGGEAP